MLLRKTKFSTLKQSKGSLTAAQCTHTYSSTGTMHRGLSLLQISAESLHLSFTDRRIEFKSIKIGKSSRTSELTLILDAK